MRRAVFRNPWLPYALVAPQIAITIVFFFWPAFDSLRLSLYRASPFGDRLIFIGGANFTRLLGDPAYFRGAATSLGFSWAVTVGGLAMALLLASLANARLPVHAVTQGGPGDATSILVYRAWKDGFDGLQLGYSAAQSVILMLLVIALTAVQFRYAEKKVTY